jgi:pyruvate kinase
VYPVVYDVPEAQSPQELYHSIFSRLLELSLVERGDLVILTKGELSGIEGGTNSLQILKVALD